MTSTVLRHPAVAGRFYPGDPDDLRTEAQGYLSQAISSTAAAKRPSVVSRPTPDTCIRDTSRGRYLRGLKFRGFAS